MLKKGLVLVLIAFILACGCSANENNNPGKKGVLRLTSTPGGADVYIDSVFSGITPETLNDIDAGNHTLELRYENYEKWLSTVEILPGQSTFLSPVLNQIPSPPPLTPDPAICNASRALNQTAPTEMIGPSATVVTVVKNPAVSSDDIKAHYNDLILGSGNMSVGRLDYPANTPTKKDEISMTSSSRKDLAVVQTFIRDFNSLSRTNKFSETISDKNSPNIIIMFIPQDGMSSIAEHAFNQELKSGKVSMAKIGRGKLYINADLEGDMRNHTLLRSLYCEAGLSGETWKYSDSLFFAGNNTNTELSDIDKKVVEQMYSSHN